MYKLLYLIMLILNYSEFRKKLKVCLDEVTESDNQLIINRGGDKNAVLISLNQYNAMQETLHLLSTENNRKRLNEAIQRQSKGEIEIHTLLDPS